VSIQSVKTSHFRNLLDTDVTLGSRFNIIAGENAQGKTNFLEALYLLTRFRSFRNAKVEELIAFGEVDAEIQAEIIVGGLEHKLVVYCNSKGKKHTSNGKRITAKNESLRQLSAVLFTPDDLQIARRGGLQRRNLIDHAVGALWPAYALLLRDYGRALQSRNRLLKEQPVALLELLEVYETQLSGLGAKIIAARRRYLNVIGPSFSKTYREISKSGVEATMHYCADDEIEALDNNTLDELKAVLLSLHQRHRQTDLARRITTVGPHGDDLELLLDGRSAKQFASQGQNRSLILSFKIAEICEIKQQLDEYPILLLDDVSSELDPQRNGYLFDFLEEIPCQVVITTTRPQLIPVTKNRVDYQVVRGDISKGKPFTAA
jgi:DNA replication and repair protein RecF